MDTTQRGQGVGSGGAAGVVGDSSRLLLRATAAAAGSGRRRSWQGAGQAWPQSRGCWQGCTHCGHGAAWHRCGVALGWRQYGGRAHRRLQLGRKPERSRPQGTITVVPPQGQATCTCSMHG